MSSGEEIWRCPAVFTKFARILGPVDTAGPIRIAPRETEPPRPRRAHRIDISFQRADLVHAFQFLAEAGQFNLVLESGLTGQVSATLRDVEPYDALVALAEANGAKVEYEARIVSVRRR